MNPNRLAETADVLIRHGLSTDDESVRKRCFDLSEVLLKHHKELRERNSIYRFVKESG